VSFFERWTGERDLVEDAPRRVYARVDEVASDRDRRGTFMDVIDADWVDGAGLDEGALSSPDLVSEAEQHVSTLLLSRRYTNRRDEGAFFEIALGDPSESGAVAQFMALDAPPLTREVVSMTRQHDDKEQALARLGSIQLIADADDERIAAAFERVGGVDAVAIYDVGQGNCAAAVVDGQPVLYFDFGLGCDANAATAPGAFNICCLCEQPPVVLSHFHHDHWAAVSRFPQAYSQTWIVPRQGATLGFTHAVLAGRIRRDGELLIWPDDEDVISGGSIEVLRCLGNNRNDSGLACVIHGPDAKRILLPGDARYSNIAHMPDPVHALVAAHHGGRTNATEAQIPTPASEAAGRLVYSYGPGNSYNHPLPLPYNRHHNVWNGKPELRTEDRADDLGHVHIYWEQGAPDVSGPHGNPNHPQAPCQR
jgi:hypothetical protein